MSTYLYGIPFRIFCGRDAAMQFYNSLQTRDTSAKNAALEGIAPANVALNFNVDSNFYSFFLIYFKELLVC